MPRPKKSPRERLQITMPEKTAHALRTFARTREREMSEILTVAFEQYRNREIFREYREKHGQPHPAEGQVSS